MKIRDGLWGSFPIFRGKSKKGRQTKLSNSPRKPIFYDDLQQKAPFSYSLLNQDSDREGACRYYRYGCEEGPNHS